jgi:hypothetical protein
MPTLLIGMGLKKKQFQWPKCKGKKFQGSRKKLTINSDVKRKIWEDK